jgi:hypothetical protein
LKNRERSKINQSTSVLHTITATIRITGSDNPLTFSSVVLVAGAAASTVGPNGRNAAHATSTAPQAATKL